MTLEQAERIPLAADRDGVIRVTGTRVTLDTIAGAFQDGATAEEIVQQYPTLDLADVYSVIGYLLRHQAELDSYLEQRAKARAKIRTENEKRSIPTDIRLRLMARHAASGLEPQKAK